VADPRRSDRGHRPGARQLETPLGTAASEFLVAAAASGSAAAHPRRELTVAAVLAAVGGAAYPRRHLTVTAVLASTDSVCPSAQVVYEGEEPIRPWFFETTEEAGDSP
jgi:hypothetical protein